MLKKLFLGLAIFFGANNAMASFTDNYAGCLDSALQIRRHMSQAWQLAKNEMPSRAKDSVFSAWDFSNVHYELQKRIPSKFSRTKGSFLELRDRVDYAEKYSYPFPWDNPQVAIFVTYAYRELYNNLAYCY